MTGSMPPDEMREALGALRWSPVDLAIEAAVSENTSRKWLSGKAPMPGPVAATLRARAAAVLAAHAAHPFPEPPPRRTYDVHQVDDLPGDAEG